MADLDLHPAAERMAELVGNVTDDQLTAPTPCTAYALGDLLDHVGGLAWAFTGAARKDVGDLGTPPPLGDAARLEPGWRQRIVSQLGELAVAWDDPAALRGMTRAGGIDFPGEVAALVAVNELVVHGWDVARASGQRYDVDEPSVALARGFVEQFSGPGSEEARGDAFGPVVPAAPDASPLDQLIALNGRDPGWSPPG